MRMTNDWRGCRKKSQQHGFRKREKNIESRKIGGFDTFRTIGAEGGCAEMGKKKEELEGGGGAFSMGDRIKEIRRYTSKKGIKSTVRLNNLTRGGGGFWGVLVGGCWVCLGVV